MEMGIEIIRSIGASSKTDIFKLKFKGIGSKGCPYRFYNP